MTDLEAQTAKYAKLLLQQCAEALRECGDFQQYPGTIVGAGLSYNGYGSLAIEVEEFLEGLPECG